MHRFVAALLALLVLGGTGLHAQSFAWVRGVGIGTFGQSVGLDVAVDAAGTVYVAGVVGGQADFDGDAQMDYASDYESPVILRYDAAGTLVQARVIQTTLSGQARGIALDGQGGFYVTGYIGGKADFDGDGTAEVTVPSQTSSLFVAHYGATGTLHWVRTTCGQGNDLAVDPSDGSVVVTGASAFCTDFDGNGRPDDDLARGVFTVKYAADGRLNWARFPRQEEGDGGQAVAVDAAGNVYVGGTTQSTADFSGNGVVDLTAPSFVARYDAEGTFQWVRGITPSAYTDGVKAVAVYGDALYVGGAVVGTVDFSGDGVPDLTAGANTVGDLFVARYSTGGAFQWARSAGGGGGSLSIARDLVATPADVYATGFLSGRVDFTGDGVPEMQRGIAMFVARYQTDGVFVNAWAQGGPSGAVFGYTEGHALAVDPGGRVYVAGVFSGDADFSGDGKATLSTSSFAWFTAQYAPASTASAPPETPGVLGVSVRPLPFGDAATITVDAAPGLEGRVELYDVVGRRVAVLHAGALHRAEVPLDGRHLPRGVYVLRVTTAAGVSSARLVTHAR